jgi:hypothetical protein
MTVENWLNIAMIIAVIMTAAATLLGPVLGSYVQVRMSQPKPAPDENQPKQVRGEKLIRVLLLLTSVYVWVPFAAFIIIRSFYMPLDHKTVLYIAMVAQGLLTPSFKTSHGTS